ncbi:MAG: hypothetical protein K8R67_18610 [Desulfobacteraceae bacterium]|nr:hypothetical protein [Desulfobacteraceae bacterium]
MYHEGFRQILAERGLNACIAITNNNPNGKNSGIAKHAIQSTLEDSNASGEVMDKPELLPMITIIILIQNHLFFRIFFFCITSSSLVAGVPRKLVRDNKDC